jgi:hypothetical protein
LIGSTDPLGNLSVCDFDLFDVTFRLFPADGDKLCVRTTFDDFEFLCCDVTFRFACLDVFGLLPDEVSCWTVRVPVDLVFTEASTFG